MNVLRKWLHAASPSEIEQLCDQADTTIGTLRQIAGEYRHGRLEMTAELAGAVAEASRKLKRPGLDPLLRIELSSTCRKCSYAQACENASANAEDELHG